MRTLLLNSGDQITKIYQGLPSDDLYVEGKPAHGGGQISDLKMEAAMPKRAVSIRKSQNRQSSEATAHASNRRVPEGGEAAPSEP